MAYELAEQYYFDRIAEDDLLHSTVARDVFARAISNGNKFAEDVEQIFGRRHLFLLWNEPYFTCEGDFKEVALSFRMTAFPGQVYSFLMLTDYALSTIPASSASRKKKWALRNWAYGHLSFWTNDLERPVTLIHDRKDGYSECHRWLRALLAEIDHDSLGALGHIVREYKKELREKSAPE